MTISIDGELHKASLNVKYGDEFPKPYSNIKIEHSYYGACKIYITGVGIPEWQSDYSVEVPIEYYITEIIIPSEGYKKDKKKKKIGLQLIKG